MPLRLIATDLDGTLIHSTGVITPRNRAALHAARQAGIHIAISTGRRHSYALHALRFLPLPTQDTPLTADAILHTTDAVISSNGAVVRTISGDLLWRGTLSLPLVHRLLASLQDFRNALVFTFDLIGPRGGDVPGALLLEDFDHLHTSIRHWMETNAASIRRVTPIENAFAPSDSPEPIQAMLCGGMNRMHQAETLLHSLFANDVDTFRTEYPGQDLCILDIVPKGKSKGAALLRLAANRGIAPEDILAIGDNWNDVPMLRAAGTGVLLRNAPADLLQHAADKGWNIGHTGDEDGVAQAIETALASH